MTTEPIYSGEAVLLNWGDSKSGRKIVLSLEKFAPGPHPFDGLDGERFAVVIVGPLAADQHDAPAQPKEPATPTRFKQRWSDLRPSARAALALEDEAFCSYVCGVSEPIDPTGADDVLKTRLGITSKRELDQDATKAAAFDRIYGNFRALQQAKQHGAA